MKSNDCYNSLLKDISAFLKKKGFSRSGSTFYIERDNNFGMIYFQKSSKSNAEEKIFTINIGICSHKLLFFSPNLLSKKPTIEICHWRKRLGHLLSDNRDVWWSIKDEEQIDALASELKLYINDMAIPAIEQHISDEQLLIEWLSGKSPGLTNIQRLENLAILLKNMNKKDLLQQVEQELKEKRNKL